jgi:hypothetical protein
MHTTSSIKDAMNLPRESRHKSKLWQSDLGNKPKSQLKKQPDEKERKNI